MHRLTQHQKETAVKLLKHLRTQNSEKCKTQQQLAEATELTQGQISRHLKTLEYIGIVDHNGSAYVQGPKADDYLFAWAVYFVEGNAKAQ